MDPFPTPKLPILQFVDRPSIIDLGWGHPDPALLPVEAIRRGCDAALARYGADTLQYGHAAGPGPLLEWLMARIAQRERRTPAPDEVITTGGASSGLVLVLTALTQPGDTVFVESPTYHLAIRILREHRLNLVSVPSDDRGMIIEHLAAQVRERRRSGRQARALYTVPTFNNPSGASLSEERRRALVDVAAAEGLAIIEDDVYRELAYDAPTPDSLWSLAPSGTVARLGSFSKSLAPGLRLGWLTAGRDLIRTITQSGLLDSGGGVNHFMAMAVATLCKDGDFDTHVAHLRSEYGARRDALVAGLTANLPRGCMFDVPAGGYFAWVKLPPSLSSDVLLPRAEELGTSFLPGSLFHLDGLGHDTIRLAFSRYPADKLTEAAQRLGLAIKSFA